MAFLHIPTLYVCGISLGLLFAGLLFVAWWQARETPALAYWAASYLLADVAAVLLAFRGTLPDVLTIDLANAVMLVAAGVLWAGVRSFFETPLPIRAVLVAPVIWLLACRFDAFRDSMVLRISLNAVLSGGVVLLTAVPLWQHRTTKSLTRDLACGLLVIHGLSNLARLPLTLMLPVPSAGLIAHSVWFSGLIFETILFSGGLALLLMTMTNERSVMVQQHAASTDALTGLSNRRAFMAQIGKALKQRVRTAQPVSLLLIDLDHFKLINDTAGHDAGDGVLQRTAEKIIAHLRVDDFVTRIGGEEFACLLPNTDIAGAVIVAEGLRLRLKYKFEHHNIALNVSASIGVTSTEAGANSVASLLKQADLALYDAKSSGRDRVICFAERDFAPQISQALSA